MVDSSTSPRLPRVALAGLMGDYVALVEPTTEAPIAFQFGAIATVLSTVFGRSFIRQGTRNLHPTLFSVLAGTTGVTHKTTAAEAAIDLMDLIEPHVQVIRGLGSREGLLPALPQDGSPVLWRAAEYTGIIQKGSRRSATATMVEMQLELYDHPTAIENRLANGTIRVENPCVTLLGDSTEAYLTKVFSDDAIGNGLLNRLSIWLGVRRAPIPFPEPIDREARTALVERITRAAEAVTDHEIEVEPAAAQRWDHIYREEVYPMQGRPGGEAIARVSEIPWKFALLYALGDGRCTVTQVDLIRGWEVAKYLAECTQRIAGQIGRSAIAEILDVVEAAVAKGGIRTAGYLKTNLSSRQRQLVEECGGSKRLLEHLRKDERISWKKGEGYFISLLRKEQRRAEKGI